MNSPRRLLLPLSALMLGPGLACSIGNGSGSVRGSISVAACTFDPDKPLTNPAYDLGANFFVGLPLDSNPITAPGFPANQMGIRVQHSGARVEFADVLMFWVLDSAAAARCIHGAPDVDPTLCDRSVLGPNGEGRLFVGMTYETVFASFALNDTCPMSYVTASALGACATPGEKCPDVTLCPGRGSWISFADFGKTPSDPTLPISAHFKVNDGERIRASAFHLELCDTATVGALLTGLVPVPKPAMVGTLDGNFDFDLQRDQGQ